MKIGIILHPYEEEKPGGLARTIFEWTKALIAVDQKNEYVIFLKGRHTRPIELPPGNWHIEELKSPRLWLEGLSKKEKMDIYLFQTPVLPIFFRPQKSVVIVQDFPYLYLPAHSVKEYIWRKIMRLYHGLSMRKADVLVAVSEATKKDIIRFFRIEDMKIEVVHMGFKPICVLPETTVELPSKFFLFVGVIKERKNVMRIVEAFNDFKKRNSSDSHVLVLAGKKEGAYYEKIRDYIKKSNLENDIFFIGYLNDRQLSYVYKRADAVVFPSVVEGFGFPTLEAMDCGIPVITTKYMGPSEIVKDAGILVDPFKVEEIAVAFEKIAGDSKLCKELIEKGRMRAKGFAWEKSAGQLLSIFSRIG